MIVLFMVISCKKEARIISDQIVPEYSLPQGNHPYDTQILEFYNKYGCYILYKFSEKDFKWNVSNNLSYIAEQGDENYIAPALEALDKYLFKFYNTDFLKKALPYKIILSSKIREITYQNDTLQTPVSCVSTISHIAFGQVDIRLTTLSASDLKAMKISLQKEFWLQAVAYGKIPLPQLFISATKYNEVFPWNKKNYGAFDNSPGLATTLYSDFASYINVIVSTTSEQLEKTLFLPANDPNGKYRLKYNIIINYYKQNYGVDLQLIALDK